MTAFDKLLESHVDVIQLRFDDHRLPSLFGLVKKMAEKAHRRNVPLVMNDRVEIVLAAGLKGVHLGKCDIPPRVARYILGPRGLVGVTTRGIKDVSRLNRREIDYFSVGPVFKTPIKSHLKPIPLDQLGKLSREASLPFVAIGGINDKNAGQLVENGVRTVAFIRYGVKGKNIRGRIEKLRRILEGNDKH